MNLTMALATLFLVALSSGFYAFAGARGKPRVFSRAIFIAASLGLAAVLLLGYYRFVAMEIPFPGGNG